MASQERLLKMSKLMEAKARGEEDLMAEVMFKNLSDYDHSSEKIKKDATALQIGSYVVSIVAGVELALAHPELLDEDLVKAMRGHVDNNI